MTANPADGRLNRREKALLALALVAVVAFGVVTELRSAFMSSRKTDFGVYARAGWAVRAGEDPYTVMDNNGWHYCYPPAFAVALAPLGDPYPYSDQAGYLPFAASAAIWYVFGVLCVAFAAHAMTGAVLPGLVPGSRGWWYARIVPAAVCGASIGATLGRGQVNMLVVALAAGMFAAVIHGRRFGAGLWLAAAVAVKIIPGLLIFFPLARRDLRPAAGLAVGSVLLFAGLPVAVWGVPGAVEMNKKVVNLVLAPGATGGGDQTRAVELTNTTATNSQSFQSVIHCWLHPDRGTRPANASSETRLAHWAIGGAMTLITIAAGWRMGRRPTASFSPPRFGEGPGEGLPFKQPHPPTPFPRSEGGAGAAADQLIYFGCLCVLMILLTPVSHKHYYAMALPLVAGLWMRSVVLRPGSHLADRRTTAVLAAWGVVTAAVLLPGAAFDAMQDFGVAPAAMIGLWALGLRLVTRREIKVEERTLARAA